MGTTVVSLSTTPCEQAHLAWLAAVKGQPAPGTQMAQAACTVWDDVGPLCCFGIARPWEGLGLAWCEERDPEAMQRQGRRVGLLIARHWRQWLTEHPYRRIESRAPVNHRQANALLTWLGFQRVVVKPHYDAQGGAVVEYVWYPSQEIGLCVAG